MIGCGLSVVGIWLIGTVFQTALLYLFFPRDFVPGYSRCARYWLPAKSTDKQQNTGNRSLVAGCRLSVIGCIELTNQIPTTDNQQPTTDNRQRI